MISNYQVHPPIHHPFSIVRMPWPSLTHSLLNKQDNLTSVNKSIASFHRISCDKFITMRRAFPQGPMVSRVTFLFSIPSRRWQQPKHIFCSSLELKGTSALCVGNATTPPKLFNALAASREKRNHFTTSLIFILHGYQHYCISYCAADCSTLNLVSSCNFCIHPP